MAYYIFLKSLRSLEEFRKNLHVKIPPKSPSTNFPSHGKFKKSNFLFEKNFSSEFSLQPACPLPQPWPAGRPKPSNPSPAQTAQPTWPLSRSARACLWRILQKTFSSSVHAFSRWPLSPSVTATRAPPVSFVVSPALADPGQNLPRAAAPPRRRLAPWMPLSFYNSPSSLPPLNPLQPER
jgi:hypothetical protein